MKPDVTAVNTESYSAIIEIDLPGVAETASIVVRLSPPDAVATGAGKVLPLAEATLADLVAYAERIEQAIVEEFLPARLTDVATREGSKVRITFLAGEEQTPDAAWLDQAIILSPGTDRAIADMAEMGIDADTELEDEPPIDDPSKMAADATPADAGHDSLEIGADSAPLPDDTVEQVRVAAPEMVFPEQEAAAAESESRPAPAMASARAMPRFAGERLPSGSATTVAVDILFSETALRACQAHALSSLQREVAGVMVGPPPEKQPDGRYLVRITDSIIARHTRMNGASVTYTPESWRYLNDTLAARYPNETAVMVGWYHTHPGFGIFLSGMDQFIHQNFFRQPWHIAYVLDPVARTSGFFAWNRVQDNVSRIAFRWPEWARGAW